MDIPYKRKRIIQIGSLVILASTINMDWGGYGYSLLHRAKYPVYAGETLEATHFMIIILGVTLIETILALLPQKFVIIKLLVTGIIIIPTVGFMLLSYAFSNFLSTNSKSFDAALPATICLGMLFFSFLSELKYSQRKQRKEGKN